MSRRTQVLAALLGALLVVALLAANLPAARMALALAICLLLPGLGWARKMRLADLGDTVALAIVLSICMTVAVGTAMAVSGSWSPKWGLATLAGVGLAGFVPARLLAARASAAVQRPRAGFANDDVAWADWYPRGTQQQAVRRARAAVTAGEVSAVGVDWYADVKRRAEEAQAREGAAKSEAIDQWISWCQRCSRRRDRVAGPRARLHLDRPGHRDRRS